MNHVFISLHHCAALESSLMVDWVGCFGISLSDHLSAGLVCGCLNEQIFSITNTHTYLQPMGSISPVIMWSFHIGGKILGIWHAVKSSKITCLHLIAVELNTWVTNIGAWYSCFMTFTHHHQANSYIERHDMFSGRKYRGVLCLLGVFISITINMTALYIRMGFGRREGHGPWNHGI